MAATLCRRPYWFHRPPKTGSSWRPSYSTARRTNEITTLGQDRNRRFGKGVMATRLAESSVVPWWRFFAKSPAVSTRRNLFYGQWYHGTVILSRNDDPDETKARHKTSKTTTDSWVHLHLPPSWRPYAQLARMDKPIGTWLLLSPCFWSTALASTSAELPWHPLPDPTLLGLFAAGAWVMRGAGCTINDLWDADYDRHVERTKSRPLASGDLSLNQATAFLALQLTAGLAILCSLPHTWVCVQWGAASLPLVATYPLMKRYTHWPQLVLGMTFNWGAFMGFAATHGTLDYQVVGPLYISGVAWTIVYDTLYAHQDKADDAKLGLKSTALYFGDTHTQPILLGFATLAASQWLLAAAPLGFYHHWSSAAVYGGGIALAYGHLLWQITTADLNRPDNLAQRFQSNQWVGALVFASCVGGNVALSMVT